MIVPPPWRLNCAMASWQAVTTERALSAITWSMNSSSHVVERLALDHVAGVVDQDVEAAERGHGLVDDALDIGLLASRRPAARSPRRPPRAPRPPPLRPWPRCGGSGPRPWPRSARSPWPRQRQCRCWHRSPAPPCRADRQAWSLPWVRTPPCRRHFVVRHQPARSHSQPPMAWYPGGWLGGGAGRLRSWLGRGAAGRASRDIAGDSPRRARRCRAG